MGGGQSVTANIGDHGGEAVVFSGRSFESGEYKRAFKGMRAGKSVVVKAYKKRWREASDFGTDLRMHRIARKLSEEYAKINRGKQIECIEPVQAVIVCSGSCLPVRAGQKVTVEPTIMGKYEKFISNNGTFRPGHPDLGAFAHWTYHNTKGRRLIIDLQGVCKRDRYVLTDPAFHSINRSFGELDLGNIGMQAFFALHKCSSSCGKDWRRPDLTGFSWKDCERIMQSRVAKSKVNPEGFGHGGSALRYA